MTKSIIFIFLLSTSNLFAQNEGQSTLFTNNYVHFNPAMSGVRYKNEANVLWRNQWTQVNGAPADLWANYTQRIDKIHGAAGITYNYDYIGFAKTHTALANYAFHIQGKNILWSLGVAAGIQNLSTSNSQYFPKGTAFQANSGIAVHTRNLNAGFSISQLNSYIYKNHQSNIAYNTAPTYHLHGDYTLNFGEKWKVTPAVHFFSDLVKTGSTTSIRATYNDKLWFGVNSWNLHSPVNSSQTLGPMLGYDFKQKFRVGYSLEFNEFRIYNNEPNLTHEVVLSFLLK